MPSRRFKELLEQRPHLAEELAALAVRRAEEVEPSEILARHFGIVDDGVLVSACASVEWVMLHPGDVLIEEGEGSDFVYFVIRGRLVTSRRDPETGLPVRIGEAGRGEVVGEIGVLAESPRQATVAAVRDSVVAAMKGQRFLELAESQPRLLVDLTLKAAARAERDTEHLSTNSILAVVSVGNIDSGEILEALELELIRHGKVHSLSARKVDGLLAAPGISESKQGDVGDVRLSRALYEMELESDTMLLDVGSAESAWARRCLGLADHVLVFTTGSPSRADLEQANAVLANCLPAAGRTVVIRHEASETPRETSRLMKLFSGEQALHFRRGSQIDLARIARVAVGRGNALVIGGGGGRGFAHIGVYRALEELGFPVDIVGGTSIGGVLGTVIADAMEVDEILAWATEHFPSVLDYTIPVVSLIKGGRITASAAATFRDRDIEDLKRTFFCMSTDLTTARPHLHRSGPVVLAIRATSAIPGVMPPVPLDDSLLVDGGVLNNLPIDVARSYSPAGKIVAIDVAPPRGPGAHGDYGLSVSGWEAFRANRGSKRSPYPGISAILMRSMIAASMRERDRQVRDGLADIYIDLDMRGVSMLEFDDPAGVAARGYEAAMPRLEEWLRAGQDS
jgi:predicted acylesterase/phospholipase RssA/CRP-like cAMP-binding protein